MRHAGHILLTDFPTKAGIPIPLMSSSGIGQILEQAGIHRGWLQLSLFDSGLGILAIAKSSTNLAQAINGTLGMNWGTFFDTFIEGGIEVGLSMTTQNPILLAGGIENILAGIVATWNKLTVYVDPLDFFGSMGVSALLGFCLAYGVAGEDISTASVDAIRSGTIGALFSISPAFGFGALAGFSAYSLGRSLAKMHNDSMRGYFSIDRHSYNLLVEEICKGNPNVKPLLKRALPHLILQEKTWILPEQPRILPDNHKTLSDDFLLLRDKPRPLAAKFRPLNADAKVLPDDPKVIRDWYQMTLA